MSAHLVDTDWLIDVLHGQAAAVQTLVDLAADGLAVSHLSYAELYEGAYYARTPEADIAALTTLLDGMELLPTTLPIMQRFAVVRGGLSAHLRRQLGDIDLIIAATALVHNLTLVTRNLKDFQHVPGLRLYQPNAAR